MLILTCTGLAVAQNKTDKTKNKTGSATSVKTLNVSSQKIATTDLKLLSQKSILQDVGYGYQKKSNVTSSVQSVNISDQQADGYSNIFEYLRGKVPGLSISYYGGDYHIRVRGVNTAVGSGEPLIVVNGIPDNQMLDGLDPRDVKSVTVLKDASATAMYGTRGANGVILIRTR